MKKFLLVLLSVLMMGLLALPAYSTVTSPQLFDEDDGSLNEYDTIAEALEALEEEEISTATLTLNGDAEEEGTINMSDYPSVTDLTINASRSRIIVAGDDYDRVFNIDNGSMTITINGGRFTAYDRDTKGGGVAISAASNVTFNNTVFTGIDNSSMEDYYDDDDEDEDSTSLNGGAVEITGSARVTFNSCEFSRNSARNGGAIYASAGNITFTGDNRFENNTASDSGGAINSSVILTFAGKPTFTNNTADSSGGAIYSSATTTFQSTSEFTNNIAGTGGAIYSGGTMTFTGSAAFTNNSADLGGAINSTAGITFSAAPDFTDNKAAANGGAINTSAALSFPSGGTFSTNTAGGSGGAINSSGTITMQGGGRFTGNISGTDGGAVNLAGSNGTFTDTVFGEAASDSNSALNGGAVYIASRGTGTFNGASFVNNSADLGGAVYAAGTVNISNGTVFGSNNAGNYALSGGAIYIPGGGSVSLSGTIDFTSNRADEDGGAIYCEGTGKITGNASVTFTSNRAGVSAPDDDPEITTGRGGAIYFNGEEIAFGTATFTRNTAQSGGAVFTSAGDMTFSGSANFGSENNPNRAYNGGALCLIGGTTTFSNTAQFSYNEATNNGGAIMTSGDSTSLVFTSIPSFSRNKAAGNGGAVYWGGTSSPFPGTFIQRTSFTNNSALNGGAIYIARDIRVELNGEDNYIFRGNHADNNGGAICADSASLVLDAFVLSDDNEAGGGGGFAYAGGSLTARNETEIFNQKAKSGGALYGGSTVNITNSIFHDNTADNKSDNDTAGSGGGAVFAGGSMTIDNSDFYDNYCNANITTIQNNGGGAVFASGDITITNTSFDNNEHTHAAGVDSSSGGGAVHAMGNVRIVDSVFTENITSNRGGAIFSDSAGMFTSDNTLFSSDMSGHHGGAVYIVDAGQATITSNTFNLNQADNDAGGALYMLAITGQVASSYFHDNRTLNGNGGSICFDQSGGVNGSAINPASTFNLTECVLTDNTANRGSGGAAYIHTDNAAIRRCTFAENESFSFYDSASGGAVYLWAELSSAITDSTFTSNVASGNPGRGGALFAQGNVSITSCTLTLGNTAEGGNSKGGAVFAGSGSLTVTATIAVGNIASVGNDIHAEAPVQSGEYNRIGVFAHGERAMLWDNYVTNDYDYDNMKMQANGYANVTWTSSTFFGPSPELADNNTTFPAVGAAPLQAVIQTVALVENASLPSGAQAIDAIPSRYVPSVIAALDQRGMSRPRPAGREVDVGAFELDQSGRGTTEDGTPYAVSEVIMSGVPSTLRSPGQTACLIAIVRYTNARTAYGGDGEGQEPVEWISSNSDRLKIENNGTVIAGYNQSGPVTITVRVKRAREDGSLAEKSVVVNVDTDLATNMNLDEDFSDYFWDYIGDLFEYDMSLSLIDASASGVERSTFQNNFTNVWNASSASLVDYSVMRTSSVSFTTVSNYAAAAYSSSGKPGININFSGLHNGDLFPLVYSWTLKGSEVKDILGEDSFDEFSTTIGSNTVNSTIAEELFKNVNINFQASGTTWPVIGGNGADLSQAMNSGALKLTRADGGQGIRIDLTAYLANVTASTTDQGPQLISGQGSRRMLIVPDGYGDSAISGTMQLVQGSSSESVSRTSERNTSSTSPSSSSSSGGGEAGSSGCNAFSLGLIGTVIFFALRKK